MIKALVYISLIVANMLFVFADEGLTVLSRTGEVKFRLKSEKAWKELKTGESLESRHVIKLGLVSKINLLRESGRYFTLEAPGEYNVDELLSKSGVSKNNYSARFLRAVYSTISSNTDYFRDNKYSRENTMSGIVLRNFSNYLTVRSPVNSCFTNENVTFCWYSKDNEVEYTFIIKDMIEREIYSAKTKDTSITVNLADAGLAKGKYYFWQIRCKKGKSDEYYIFRMADEKSSAIADTLAFIEKELLNTNSPESGIVKAQFLEDNNLIYDSEITYRNLLKISDCSEAYKKLFVLFLIRQNMLIEADINLD